MSCRRNPFSHGDLPAKGKELFIKLVEKHVQISIGILSMFHYELVNRFSLFTWKTDKAEHGSLKRQLVS